MKYLKILYIQVLIAILLGILTGYLFPGFSSTAKFISEIFINLIKMIIAPVIFISIVLGIAGAGDLKKMGRVGVKGLIYFELVTTAAIIIGLIAGNLITPGSGISHEVLNSSSLQATSKPGAGGIDWREFIFHIVPSNVVEAFAKGDIIQVLFFAILFAIALAKLGSSGQSVLNGFEKLNKILFNILHMVIRVSPIGAFGGMAYTIGKFGFTTLALLGKLLLTFYITGLLFIFVVLYLILKFNGFSLWKLLGYIKTELLIVLGSSSSEAVLPNIMEKLEKAGCSKSVVGLIIPAGYSFNLDGTSIYLSLSVIFLAQVFHVDLTLGQELGIIGILLLTSKGAAGVTGSGFLVLTSTLTALNIIPLEGLALLVGVDRFMSEGRALVNVIGNTVAAVVISKSEKAIDYKKYKLIVEGNTKINMMGNSIFKHAKVHVQLSPDELIKATVQNNQGSINNTGALCIHTGKFTGRSPKDKYIVESEETAANIDWGNFNNPIDEKYYTLLKEDVLKYLDSKNELWQRKCFTCSHPDYQLEINVITEFPSSNLFAYNMFLRPEDVETEESISKWTIIQAPDFQANTEIHGTRSSNFSIISFTDKTILIGGTGYTGEIKKGIFTVLNYILPQQYNVLSMHCSANMDSSGDVALFFGLSGTGKTTLSTDPNRRLIGDDEHGWDNESVFNFEGGCYAKVIGLDPKNEPDIYAAIKEGALVENTIFHNNSNIIDFNNNSITENTRVSYPINFIKNITVPSKGGIPSTIFFLTCDASGVFPPISKLTIAQAKYYFLSGYTSKVAGTETGVTEPQPTFSTCFGAPFLPLHPAKYADLLGEKLEKHKINVWMINTGWSGLSYKDGQRISIKDTRAMVTAALNGSLEAQNFETFPVFNLQVPTSCPGISNEILNPFHQNKNLPDYEFRLNNLAEKFENNFKKFNNLVDQETIEANPVKITNQEL